MTTSSSSATNGLKDHHSSSNNAENGGSSKPPANGGTWRSIDPGELSPSARYGLCISAVVPRPVAVITSVSGDGILNCAPFSYSGISSHDPPIVTHGICLSRGNKKDTLHNIEATEQWVFNVLTTHYLEKANQCAAPVGPDVDETQLSGLRTVPSDVVKVPRLVEAAVAMECRLVDRKEIYNDDGEHTTTIVMGRVVRFHVRESVLRRDADGQEDSSLSNHPLVDLTELQAVGRAGDITYWPVGTTPDTVRAIPRPK